MSAVDPRGYSCDCPHGMRLSDDEKNCTGTAIQTVTGKDMQTCRYEYIERSHYVFRGGLHVHIIIIIQVQVPA